MTNEEIADATAKGLVRVLIEGIDGAPCPKDELSAVTEALVKEMAPHILRAIVAAGGGPVLHEGRRRCCKIGCNAPPVFEIWDRNDPRPEAPTEACEEHLGEPPVEPKGPWTICLI